MILLAILGLALGVAPAAEVTPATAPAVVEETGLRQLLSIRRMYVDHLTGGETAAQFRDILISSLEGAKLFILTENEERADVFLRGAAEDLVFTDTHSSSDSINAHANVGSGKTTSSRNYAGVSVGESESDRSAERRHEAIAAVRLVNKDGDVIWSTTQESLGAKFRGASADVAEKITGRLKEDYDKARKLGRAPAVIPQPGVTKTSATSTQN
jgi:hypothetical protein